MPSPSNNAYGLNTIIRFIGTGGLATVSHWISMAALIAMGMDALYATMTGAIIGAIVNYILQSRVTFKISGGHARNIPVYLVATTGSWCANAALFFLIIKFIGLPASAAQVITTGLVAILNYFLYSKLVFIAGHAKKSHHTH